jgi:hypothetical protein
MRLALLPCILVLGACAHQPAPATGAALADCAALQPATGAAPWTAHPKVAGVRVQTLAGAPASEGYFRYRLQLPAGFHVEPHWHTAALNMSVLCGAVQIGRPGANGGEVFASHAVGAYDRFEAGAVHSESSRDGAVLEVSGVGPASMQFPPAPGG